MSIAWPSTLPNPVQDYSGSSTIPVIQTEFETGRVRKRRRFARRHTLVRLSWVLTNSQFSTFKTFMRDTTEGGSVWFNILLPGEETSEMTLSKVRFAESKYDYRYQSHQRWRVTAAFEKFQEDSISDPEPDIMPLLYQRVQTKTGNFTLAFTDLNSFFVINNGETDVVITLPANAGFTDKFSCAFTKTGTGEVTVQPEVGVTVQSQLFEDAPMRAIWGENTLATIAYVGSNTFFIGGSLKPVEP